MWTPHELPPAWVELLACCILLILIIGIPVGYIIQRDGNKLIGYSILMITICGWLFVIYKGMFSR